MFIWVFLIIFGVVAKSKARQRQMGTMAYVRTFSQRNRQMHNQQAMMGALQARVGGGMVPVAQPQMAMPVGGVAAVPMAMAVPSGQAPVVVDATPMGVVSGVVLPDSQRGGTSSGVVEEIEKLHQMKIKGILTEAQFQAAKDKVLAQPAMPGTEMVTTTTTTTGFY